MRTLSIALLLALAGMASSAEASHLHCNRCGCHQNCRKVCRLVCGTKKEKKTEYSCECEDFCVPGPSERCGTKCECNRLGIKCCHPVYKPVCAKVRTKRVLVKKEVTKEVPEYKWVVEEVCCKCGEKIEGTQKTAAAPKPLAALFAGPVGGEGALFEAPDDIRQVSAEEEAVAEAPAAAGDEVEAVFVSDDAGEATAAVETGAETPTVEATAEGATKKRRGLLQWMFGN